MADKGFMEHDRVLVDEVDERGIDMEISINIKVNKDYEMPCSNA